MTSYLGHFCEVTLQDCLLVSISSPCEYRYVKNDLKSALTKIKAQTIGYRTNPVAAVAAPATDAAGRPTAEMSCVYR